MFLDFASIYHIFVSTFETFAVGKFGDVLYYITIYQLIFLLGFYYYYYY